MKKILMICLALVMGLGMCAAAGKPAQKKEVTTVFVTDIDCEHCVKKIMNNVPSLGKGIKDVKVDLPKKEVTVIYDASKNNDENIVKAKSVIRSLKSGHSVVTQAAISAAKQPAPPAVSSHVSRRSRRRVSRRIRSISRGVKPAGSSGGGTCRTARRIASLCSIHLVVYQYI